jgi:hypothetical protein
MSTFGVRWALGDGEKIGEKEENINLKGFF